MLLEFLENFTYSQRRIDPTTPCYCTAKEAVKAAQEKGEGGTLLLATGGPEGEGSHISFTPLKSLKQIRNGSFSTREPVISEPGPIDFQFDDIADYQKFMLAERVEILRIRPTDDFDRVLRKVVCLSQLAYVRTILGPALRETARDFVNLGRKT